MAPPGPHGTLPGPLHRREPLARLLLIHHTLQPPGGGSAVGAWALQALAGSHDVTLLSWTPVDAEAVDAAFGTRLVQARFRALGVPAGMRRAVEALPANLALLSMNLILREARRLLAQERFDAVVSTMNEVELGVPAIQYVHYPWHRYPRPAEDLRWFHFDWLVRGYRRLCEGLSGYRQERVGRNLTLVNSAWTGRVYEGWYHAPWQVLHPPVPSEYPARPWEEREDAFVCLGRIAPEKNQLLALEVLRRVRARGHPVRLRLVGHLDHGGYARAVRRAVEQEAEWATLHADLSRDELETLLSRCRYGLHLMWEEHFGIAPAEIQAAGALVFVPDDGGQVEIVGGDRRLLFGSVEEAVERIDAVLGDAELRRTLREEAARRARRFGTDRFVRELNQVVSGFLAERG